MFTYCSFFLNLNLCISFRLDEFKSKYYTEQSYNRNVWEHCSDLKRKLEDQGNELEIVNGKLDR